MATDIRTLRFENYSSDQAMRDWMRGVSLALQACGLVKTEDTGQINFTSVVRAVPSQTGGGEFIRGYEIFRFNDALQSTRPVFIKVEYGHINNGNTNWGFYNYGPPLLWVTVGTSTNGAGGMTGLIMLRQRWVGGTAVNQSFNSTQVDNDFNSPPSVCYTSGDGSSIQCVLGANSSYQWIYWGVGSGIRFWSSLPGYLWIERTRNIDGTINDDGVVFGTSKWQTSTWEVPTAPVTTYQVHNFRSGQISAAQDHWPITWPSNLFSTSTQGAELFTFPAAISTPRKHDALGFLGIYKGDTSLGTDLSLSVLGQPHTYRMVGAVAGLATNDRARGYINNHVNQGALLMRWE